MSRQGFGPRFVFERRDREKKAVMMSDGFWRAARAGDKKGGGGV